MKKFLIVVSFIFMIFNFRQNETIILEKNLLRLWVWEGIRQNIRTAFFLQIILQLRNFQKWTKKVIELLYREALEVGMNKTEVLKTLRNRITDE